MFRGLFSTGRKHALRRDGHHARRRQAGFEPLEPRTLMSAAPLQVFAVHDATLADRAPLAANVAPALASSSSLQTLFTARDLRSAYGLNRISFGSTPADGRGQTVAITGLGSDPNIWNELATFDTLMGVPTASLTVYQEIYNGTAPYANASWEGEMAMDVELVHAFAPGAKIVLYEANQRDPAGLYQCVDWARNLPGVSVVSMSWGLTAGESSAEGYIDGLFTTPWRHTGVTFVASAGDHGLPSYPADSPNVLSVGGTKLTMSGGNYYSESVWNDGYDASHVYWATGGGYSSYEAEPSYQYGAEWTGRRGAVDVSLNAEPNTLIYSVAEGGWTFLGGTSASAPEMAGIIAVADQGRAMQGRGSFAGVNAALYALPATDFHDVTAGNNGYYWAGAGWDPVTGRGSPLADRLIRDLAGSSYATSPQYGLGNYVGINILRQYPNYFFGSVAGAKLPASTVAATQPAGGAANSGSPGDSLRSVAGSWRGNAPASAIQPGQRTGHDDLLDTFERDSAISVAGRQAVHLSAIDALDAVFASDDELGLLKLGAARLIGPIA